MTLKKYIINYFNVNGIASKIIVIADDLTGAAEIGGIAWQFGLSVRVLNEKTFLSDFIENVVILNTASRSCDSLQAQQIIRDLFLNHRFAKYDLIYKKIDSVLRGSVVAELIAFLEESGFERVLLIPANPSKERIIVRGRYMVAGIPLNKTYFRNDPLHPRLSADVQDLLGGHTYVKTGAEINFNSDGKVFIPDIGSENDIKKYLQRISFLDFLMAGGSDFFKTILSVNLKPQTNRNSNLKITAGKFASFVIGSKTDTSLNLVDMLKKLGFNFYPLPVEAIRNDSIFEKWIHIIGNQVRAGFNVVVTGPSSMVMNLDEISMITKKLAFAGRVIIENSKQSTHLCLEGGDTAFAFVQEMCWRSLVVLQVHDLGVVTLQPEGIDAMITIKPGSYFWPSKLLELLKPDNF